MLITEQNLTNVLLAILLQCGSDGSEARLVAEHLVRANLTGHDSHGAGMLPGYIKNLRAGFLRPGTAAPDQRRRRDPGVRRRTGIRPTGGCRGDGGRHCALQGNRSGGHGAP